MENNTNTHATQLHDLIQILTERVETYRAIISSVDANKDIDLIAFLEKCMQLTQQFKSELNGVLAKEDSPFSEREWVASNLYTRWQEEKPSVEAIGRDQVIEVCEKTENTLLRIFQEILSNTGSFTESTTAMLKSQATLQQEIVEQIKGATKATDQER
ncbi:hypothetical protein H8B06_06310 [Sphingobacterium sp. DN00404]|uniref:DUF2383 domain-containing protein n=1 Tax=Sphingobacterium micropteri TaxID=2763501 RepID=A0ABR7YM69_9SPHI|nr:hypothetical protein [Sphingobacterium micropteri]MBD1432430.1 hypothetical protein [Sphingobacterium micropteri]